VIFRFISDWERRQGMAFREVWVTQVREVLRAWLAGAGKRPAARRAGVDVKTAARYIRAAQAAGLARGGDEAQLSDELIGQVNSSFRSGTALTSPLTRKSAPGTAKHQPPASSSFRR
jgi:hypothetical protein